MYPRLRWKWMDPQSATWVVSPELDCRGLTVGYLLMLDLFFVLLTVLFFAAAWMFVKGCDRL